MTLFDQLRRDEGFRSRAYKDTTGALTIGYGHNLDANGISETVADVLLHEKVTEVYRALEGQSWFWTLSDARAGVIVNMAFNLGVPGLLGFPKMIAALQARNYDEAAAEMIDSTWAKQVGARAKRLAFQMRTDQWQ